MDCLGSRSRVIRISTHLSVQPALLLLWLRSSPRRHIHFPEESIKTRRLSSQTGSKRWCLNLCLSQIECLQPGTPIHSVSN
jgi:hypothetical protein